MRRALLPATLAVAALLAVPAVAGAMSHPKLTGVVGKNNAYKITLSNSKGVVKTLKAGTYTLVIHDDSSLHSYSLDGPHGKAWDFTSVPYKGTKTVTLKLTPGKYKAYCQAHESAMFQHFTVS
jgi:plastocyanin